MKHKIMKCIRENGRKINKTIDRKWETVTWAGWLLYVCVFVCGERGRELPVRIIISLSRLCLCVFVYLLFTLSGLGYIWVDGNDSFARK